MLGIQQLIWKRKDNVVILWLNPDLNDFIVFCFINTHELEWNMIGSLIFLLISHKGHILILLLRFFVKFGITTKSALLYFDIVESFACQTPPFILILFTLTNLDTSFFRTFLMLRLLFFFLLLCLLFLRLLFWTNYLSSIPIPHTCVHVFILSKF